MGSTGHSLTCVGYLAEELSFQLSDVRPKLHKIPLAGAVSDAIDKDVTSGIGADYC